MADLNSTSPDIYHQVNNNETPTHYERRLDSFPNVSEKTWKIIIDTENNIATILVSSETKQQTEALSEDFKQEFIEKLKKLPDFEWSKVQEAIEKQTIEIKKIPDRNWYAIYESKIWNLVYITKLDWTRYTNVDYFRDTPWYEDSLQAWYIREWYSKITLENWLWKLYNKNWKEILIYSDEYMVATLNAVNIMWDVADYIVNYKIEKKEN